MVTIMELLKKRYETVRTTYEQAFPGEQPPEFPDTPINLQDVVHVIEQMLAAITERQPMIVEVGKPWVSDKHDA